MKTSLLTLTLALLLLTTHARPHASPHAAKDAAATATAASACRHCGEAVLREGRLFADGRLRLGKPAEFDDGVGISGGRCYPLYDGGELLAWLDAYHAVGPRTFLRRCVEDPSLKNVAPGSRGGYVGDAFDELRPGAGGRRAQFVKLEPPLWSEFANPAFCGEHLAYWGAEFSEGGPVKVFAVVYDLVAGAVVRREPVGTARPESDSRGFFTPPRWGDDGLSVTFDPGDGARAGASDGALRTLTLRVQ